MQHDYKRNSAIRFHRIPLHFPNGQYHVGGVVHCHIARLPDTARRDIMYRVCRQQTTAAGAADDSGTRRQKHHADIQRRYNIRFLLDEEQVGK